MEKTPRKSGQARREEIARAVLEILGEQGIAAVTTRNLAQRVGLTTGALFRHFPTTEAMLCEAVRVARAQVDATFPDPGLPPLRRVLTLARARVALMGGSPGVAWLFRSEQARQSLPEECVDQLQELSIRSRGYLLDALREGVTNGSIRPDIPAEDLLVPVLGTIHALIGMRGIHDSPVNGQGQTIERVLAALELMLSPPSPVAHD